MNIHISDVVCSKLKGVDVQNNVCNTNSKIVSKNLVYTAACMIFSDPDQAILEPIVNSIDA